QTQNALVRATGIDRSTLADLVGRLLAKGLLARERSAADARANTVRLSDTGRAAFEAGVAPAADADARLLGLLGPKKREAFVKALGVIAAQAGGPRAEGTAKVKAVKAKGVKAGAVGGKAAKAGKKKKKKPRKAKDIGA
ncbi:MAG: MarR family winged helix-turn-helix transcriptional regulator, partial [Caulobacteraceae bacterium]